MQYVRRGRQLTTSYYLTFQSLKYSLTNNELDLVTNPEVLLTKNRVIKKVCEMFGDLSEDYEKHAAGFPDISNRAKISRGENYEGLPYVMLDYPRQFGKQDVFAIRTFFWWGNFFSITLQLAGSYQQQFATNVQEAIYKDLLNEWFITSSDNAWHHRFHEGYYVPINNRGNYKLGEYPFIKIATKIPLDKWDEAEDFLTRNFALLVQVLQ